MSFMLRLLMTTVLASLGIGLASADPDQDAIRHLLVSTFDKPESKLVVDPIVVIRDHAIAGWSQDDMGGRALLHRRHAKWSLILCSGDGIRSAATLRQAGVPSTDAAALARNLAESERGLNPERLALFARFEGTLLMDGSGGHPQHPQVQQVQMQHSPTHTPSVRTFKVGEIVIEAPWVRATPQGAKVAGGFMKITNTGKESDRLVGGTLDHASRLEIHETTMVDNVARMRPLPTGLEIKPGATIELKPGGYHVMGMDLHGGYTQGQTVKGSLIFEKAGTVAVEYVVGPMGGAAPHG